MVLREIVGKVIKDKMDKTVVVAVSNKTSHRKYNKTLPKTKKYFVHDADNQYKVGDIVKIQLTRPISKNKCWTVISDINR